jgi:aminoglycoside phosphotransferase (APT) family kinase protein
MALILAPCEAPAPRLVATIASDGLGSWIFMEDLGDGDDASIAGERAIGYGRALARLHAIGAMNGDAKLLPTRTPSFHVDRAAEVADTLHRLRYQANAPSLAIDQAVESLNGVIQGWPSIASTLDRHDTTLTHGDLANKHVRWSARGSILFIDWAEAAWDSPAVDLFGLANIERSAARAYVEDLAQVHPSIRWDIARLIHVGRILRAVQGLAWASTRYESGSADRATSQMLFYGVDIRAALRGLSS